MLFFTVAAPIYFPISSAKGSNLSACLFTLTIFCSFDSDHPNVCEVIPNCVFDLPFFMISDVGHLFLGLLAICLSS